MKVLQEAYDNFLKGMEGRDYPKCFESKKQYESWYEVETIAHTKTRMFPCRDCTPEYRELMVAEGRCVNGHLSGVNRIMGKG